MHLVQPASCMYQNLPFGKIKLIKSSKNRSLVLCLEHQIWMGWNLYALKPPSHLATVFFSEIHPVISISNFSSLCRLFQLLHKEAGRRLGSGPGGSDEIKNHKWFKSINWKRLEARQIQPSFRPNVAGKTCIANFDECWTSMPVLDSPVASPVAANSNFVGFSYVRPAPFLQKPSPLGWGATSVIREDRSWS